jgi:hypothetical protein
MTKFEVRKRNGGMVAEFETQAEAAVYLDGKDDPLLYVEEIEPPPTPPPPPNKFEIWYGEMFEKRWFRCLNGLVLFGIGWAVLINADKQIYTYAGWACMIIGGLFAFEISLALIGIYALFTIIDGLKNLSTPIAILLGACIIAYVIYIKKK